MKALSLSLVIAAMASNAMAAPLLSDYFNVANYGIDVGEASGVTYNRDTGTLYAVGDEGQSIVELSLTGQTLSFMTFDTSGSSDARALNDPEGLSYIGGGKILIADERRNVAVVTTYIAGATRTLSQLTPTSYSFGPPEGNTGLEGASYDPITGAYWGVKELGPVKIYQMDGPGGPVTEPVSTRNIGRLGVSQVSDIFVMANSGAFDLNDPRRLNLLLLARDANEIIEITRAGVVVDRLSIASIGRHTIEGLTMDDLGNIYLTSEGTPTTDPTARASSLHVLTAVPEPSTCALAFTAFLGVLICGKIRRSNSA